ncbi:ATP-binding protein, partial [Klebsiella pneumoniae]|nr:ATP-binding protein [Klebsiella pneumoniae]
EVSTPSLVEPLDETVELSIYRVVQEALTNAFRHANASKVVVSVARLATNAATPGWIRVEVRDNGGGLAPNHK